MYYRHGIFTNGGLLDSSLHFDDNANSHLRVRLFQEKGLVNNQRFNEDSAFCKQNRFFHNSICEEFHDTDCNWVRTIATSCGIAEIRQDVEQGVFSVRRFSSIGDLGHGPALDSWLSQIADLFV